MVDLDRGIDDHGNEVDVIVDALSVAHVGELRSGPPATGAEPQRDVLLRAHVGWLALLDGSEPTDDVSFCVVLEDDDGFDVVLLADASFCVTLEDDDAFDVALADDASFCVVLEDDDEVQI